MKCPSQIGASQTSFYTGILHPSSVQVQHNSTNHLIIGKLCKATLFLQHSCCLSIDPNVPGVGLAVVTCVRCWEGFKAVSEGLVHQCYLGCPGAHLLALTDSSKLPHSTNLMPRAGLSFSLFYLSTNNTRVSNKISLPLYIAMYNVN